MSENNAKIIVVSAPSGCGKGTILHEVFKNTDAFYSVSCTTREPRDEDKDGETYHFMDRAGFEKIIAEDGFLEYAEYADNYYGTPRAQTEQNLAAGRDVILEIETKGAFQVKEKVPEAVLIFILPPSVKELDRRLHKRGTEKEDVIAKRIAEAVGEIEKSYKYDYVIMNDALEDAVADFETVLKAVKLGDSSADRFRADSEYSKKMIKEVLDNA